MFAHFQSRIRDTWFISKSDGDKVRAIVLNATMARRRGDIDVACYCDAIDWASSIDRAVAADEVAVIAERSNHHGVITLRAAHLGLGT